VPVWDRSFQSDAWTALRWDVAMLRERAQAANKKLTLCKPSPSVAQILDIANFSKLFEINA
jgi:hypothetical protein